MFLSTAERADICFVAYFCVQPSCVFFFFFVRVGQSNKVMFVSRNEHKFGCFIHPLPSPPPPVKTESAKLLHWENTLSKNMVIGFTGQVIFVGKRFGWQAADILS